MLVEDAIKVLKEQPKYLIENNCLVGEVSEIVAALDLAISAIERDSTYRRALYLLDATYRLLEKQVESRYVLNILETTVDYDDADCDGNCLMEDIKDLFFEAEYHPEPPKEDKP